MHAVDALRRFGGIASRSQLLQLVDRGEIERGLSAGVVVRDARGAYALPTASVALRAAAAHCGTVSHLSAAAAWGWKVKTPPERPHLIVPRNRNVHPSLRQRFTPHWADLRPDEVRDRVTSPERTLADCLTSLAPDEAQCVVDSALRAGTVDRDTPSLIARSLTGPGSAQARRIAAMADGRADNPFESTLRWIASGVRGLDVVPQVVISEGGFTCQPDLVDASRRIVLEAESATWHTSRAALKKDCRRYNRLSLLGWLVLRFVWEDVMFDADYVRSELVAAASERAQPSRRRRRVA